MRPQGRPGGRPARPGAGRGRRRQEEPPPHSGRAPGSDAGDAGRSWGFATRRIKSPPAGPPLLGKVRKAQAGGWGSDERARSEGGGPGEERAPGLPNFAVWGFAAPRFALGAREFGPPHPRRNPAGLRVPAPGRPRRGRPARGRGPSRGSPPPDTHARSLAKPGWRRRPLPSRARTRAGQAGEGVPVVCPTHRRWQGSLTARDVTPPPHTQPHLDPGRLRRDTQGVPFTQSHPELP